MYTDMHYADDIAISVPDQKENSYLTGGILVRYLRMGMNIENVMVDNQG